MTSPAAVIIQAISVALSIRAVSSSNFHRDGGSWMKSPRILIVISDKKSVIQRFFPNDILKFADIDKECAKYAGTKKHCVSTSPQHTFHALG
jgi:hypothetical protein